MHKAQKTLLLELSQGKHWFLTWDSCEAIGSLLREYEALREQWVETRESHSKLSRQAQECAQRNLDLDFLLKDCNHARTEDNKKTQTSYVKFLEDVQGILQEEISWRKALFSGCVSSLEMTDKPIETSQKNN